VWDEGVGRGWEVIMGRRERWLWEGVKKCFSLLDRESLSSNWEWEHYMQAKRCNTLWAYMSSS